jgi:hypothetical protein
VYVEFTAWPKPADEQAIWRYVDFTKLVAMLAGKALYFPQVDQLDDRFEGTYTKANPPFAFPPTGRPDLDEKLKELIPKRNATLGVVRKTMFVNCWHANSFESAAMWKLYLQSKEGVAIRTTFGRARESLNAADEIVYGNSVEYLDYNRDIIPPDNILFPYLCKRMSFAHEQEARFWHWDGELFVQRSNQDDAPANQLPVLPGKNIRVDLDKLIERVHVAPTTPTWFLELVKSVLDKYGLQKEVMRSSLDDGPVM